MGGEGCVDLELAHQTSVEADHIEIVQPQVAAHLLQRAIQFHQPQIVAKSLHQSNVVDAGAAGVRVTQAARPAGAVVGEDQHALARRVVRHGPFDEVRQRGAVRHVDFAQVRQFLGAEAAHVAVLGDEEAFGARPVAHAGIAAVEAVGLRHDGDLVRRTDQFRLLQIDHDIFFKDIVVGVAVQHNQPFGFVRLGMYGCGQCDG